MFSRALVSTSDKTGLVEFLGPLQKQGCEIVSTGGTSKYLRDNGIKVTEVAEVTGFPEVMDGRVRTLHPKIHMGLLARSFVPEDFELLKSHGVKPFDLVVVNLYPFAAALEKGLTGHDLIENIDIGGPSLLRAAAKSFERMVVLCDPDDYSKVIEMKTAGSLDEDARREFAAKVFEHCSYYDSMVAGALTQRDPLESKTMTLGLKKKSDLRYGENPHQRAVWYETTTRKSHSLSQAKQLQGKELSYNNILDLEAAVGVVLDFENPACSIIKHLNPCGVAVRNDALEAYTKAFEADTVSAFGGIVAFNRPVDEAVANQLVIPFLECVIAPEFSNGALSVLGKKKNLRIMALPNLLNKPDFSKEELEFKSLRGGALVETADKPCEWSDSFTIVGEKPSAKMKDDLVFAQRVVRHVKSNAIVIAKDSQTIGICGGQTNRVDSVRIAIERTQGRGQDLILASDAFFPFRDSVDLAAKNRIKWIIQPGGSLRDQEVQAAAVEHKINMVITGTRHFKH